MNICETDPGLNGNGRMLLGEEASLGQESKGIGLQLAVIDDPMAQYKADIRQYQLLSPDEKRKLIRQLGDDDKEVAANAGRQLLYGHVGMVISIASRFQDKGLELLDLIQIGNEALWLAIERFDPSFENELSTYAYKCIKGRIQNALACNGREVRLPRETRAELRKIYGAEEELSQELGRYPTNVEIAERLGITVKKLHATLKAGQPPISSDTIHWLSDERIDDASNQLDINTLLKMLPDFLASLTDKERDIMERIYGLNGRDVASKIQIGKTHGCSGTTIVKIERSILYKLREAFNNAYR
jgi:RNA polymerase sigma factor (sigma-70 family)